MPELHWRYGYLGVVVVVIVTCAVLFVRFRRAGWIQPELLTAVFASPGMALAQDLLAVRAPRAGGVPRPGRRLR